MQARNAEKNRFFPRTKEKGAWDKTGGRLNLTRFDESDGGMDGELKKPGCITREKKSNIGIS
jgi:hypothetical protein